MKLIGVFSDDKESTSFRFYTHANKLIFAGIDTKINFDKLTIEFDDQRWLYITIATNEDLQQIKGIEFDQVLTYITDIDFHNQILTRLRP